MDITGRAGLFLEGRVSPELQGVEISITERGAAAPFITVVTNEKGAYRYENRVAADSSRTNPTDCVQLILLKVQDLQSN